MQRVSKYASLLHGRGIRRSLRAPCQPPMPYLRPPRLSRRILAGAAVVAVLLATWTSFSAAAKLIATGADRTSLAASSSGEVPASIQLAQAFTSALNRHDVEALVALFTEEDAGPTVTADRYPWQKFEIRVWAERQVAANIHVEASGYWIDQHGATWDAEVQRDDWSGLGVSSLLVTNSVWVQHGKLASFTSQPREARDAERLGDLWRPDASPKRRT
jgi:hypothetical protein